MTTKKPKKKSDKVMIFMDDPTNIEPNAKIDDLIDQLNRLEKKCKFWENTCFPGETSMGDILGIVPISRTITKSIGGHFFPYDKKIDQIVSKFVVIDLCNQKGLELTDLEVIKQSNFEEYGIEYIKHFDINYIIGRVESIT